MGKTGTDPFVGRKTGEGHQLLEQPVAHTRPFYPLSTESHYNNLRAWLQLS
jgi:hypothetical protein